ncbi:MAG: hypothetical protein ABEJ91_03300 [Candidatus Nanohaloarchaea archaeon]
MLTSVAAAQVPRNNNPNCPEGEEWVETSQGGACLDINQEQSQQSSSDRIRNMENPNKGNYLEIRTQGNGETWVNFVLTNGGKHIRDSATEAKDGTTTAYSNAGDILFHDIDHAWGNHDEVCVIKPRNDMGGDSEPIIIEQTGRLVEHLGGTSNLRYTGVYCSNSNEDGRSVFESLSFNNAREWKNDNIGIDDNRGKKFEFDLSSWSSVTSRGVFAPEAEIIRGYVRPTMADGSKCKSCDWDEGPYWFICRGQYQESNKEVRVNGNRYQCQSNGVWKQVGETSNDGISIEWTSPEEAEGGKKVTLGQGKSLVATARIKNVPEPSTGRTFMTISGSGFRYITGSPAKNTNERSIPPEALSRSCQGSTCTVSVSWTTSAGNWGFSFQAGYTKPNGEIIRSSSFKVDAQKGGASPTNGPFPPETRDTTGDEKTGDDGSSSRDSSGSSGQIRSMSKMEVNSATPTDVDLTWHVGKDRLPGNALENGQLREVARKPESWSIAFKPFGSSAGIKGLMPAEPPTENRSAVTFRFDSTQENTLLPNNEASGADEPTSYLVEQKYNVRMNFEPEGGTEKNNQNVYSFTSKKLSVGVGGTNECRLPVDYELSSGGLTELVSEAPEGSESTATVYPGTVRPSSSCSLLVFVRQDDVSTLDYSSIQNHVSNGNLYLKWGHEASKLNTVEYWSTPVIQVQKTATSRYTTYNSEEKIIVMRVRMTDKAIYHQTGEQRAFSYDKYSLQTASVLKDDGGVHVYSVQGTDYPIELGCSENCAKETSKTGTQEDTTSDSTTDGSGADGSTTGDGTTDGGTTTGGTTDGTTDGSGTTGNPSSVEYTWWGSEMESQYVKANQEGVSACEGVDLGSGFQSLQQCQLSIIQNCQSGGAQCHGRFLQLCDWLSLPDDYGKCPAPSEISQVYKGGSQ